MFIVFPVWFWTSIGWLKRNKYFCDFILCGSLTQLVNQWSRIYNMTGSRPCISRKGQFCEGRDSGGSWMGCSCQYLSHKTCQNVGKECKVNNGKPVGKKRLLKTIALAVKLWQKSPEKLNESVVNHSVMSLAESIRWV